MRVSYLTALSLMNPYIKIGQKDMPDLPQDLSDEELEKLYQEYYKNTRSNPKSNALELFLTDKYQLGQTIHVQNLSTGVIYKITSSPDAEAIYVQPMQYTLSDIPGGRSYPFVDGTFPWNDVESAYFSGSDFALLS